MQCLSGILTFLSILSGHFPVEFRSSMNLSKNYFGFCNKTILYADSNSEHRFKNSIYSQHCLWYKILIVCFAFLCKHAYHFLLQVQASPVHGITENTSFEHLTKKSNYLNADRFSITSQNQFVL